MIFNFYKVRKGVNYTVEKNGDNQINLFYGASDKKPVLIGCVLKDTNNNAYIQLAESYESKKHASAINNFIEYLDNRGIKITTTKNYIDNNLVDLLATLDKIGNESQQ